MSPREFDAVPSILLQWCSVRPASQSNPAGRASAPDSDPVAETDPAQPDPQSDRSRSARPRSFARGASAPRPYIWRVQSATQAEITLLPGARALLAFHARELPQRDDLCGAFCAALALRAGGIEAHGGDPVDQDAVAIAAGSIVSAVADTSILPFDEQGRRDYRLEIPTVEDSAVSGTTAGGLVRAVKELSGGRLAAIPYRGPWTAESLDGLFEMACGLTGPVTLVANFATHHLWGARPGVPEMLAYLLDGTQDGPAPDWDVGHFACVVGRVKGPRGTLYCVADTYPSLGTGGVHLQPAERLARAVERRDMPAGGIIVVTTADDAAAVRSGAGGMGLVEGIWDNGTVTVGTPT